MKKKPTKGLQPAVNDAITLEQYLRWRDDDDRKDVVFIRPRSEEWWA